MKRAFLLFAVLAFAACGPTVGDPCTTGSDCLGQVCITTAGAPGGYCSLSCQSGSNDCPTGSECVTNGLSPTTNGCFRTCKTSLDCRSGYQCMNEHGSDHAICIGPKGI